ncbi:MAG: DNA-processing protein DprA [Treponema sp.]|nr:DNA-processing protein DprA [Treponema sp.]
MQNDLLELMIMDLMIQRLPGLKGNEKIELLKRFDREEDFSLLAKGGIEEILGRSLENHSWSMDEIHNQAVRDAEAAKKLGIQMVSFRDEAYPPLLREIFDPPVLLFFRGKLPDPERPLVAIVGTRKPSSAAAARAYALGRQFAEAGIAVVSGLALGIDSLAHRGNVDGGAPTAAVLGSSPDMVYPASNRSLARRILETGGLILSEYPPGTGPMRWNFPERNRIISALARGVLIVEAPEKSGALITARFALEQGRDLWMDAVGLKSPQGTGMQPFVEDGAKVVSAAEDILAEWNMISNVRNEQYGVKV